MIDPLQMTGLFVPIANGLAQQAGKVIDNRENQRTVRLQSQLDTANSAGVCIQAILAEYNQYKVVSEQERTERTAIKSREKIDLRKIESQQAIFLSFLDKSFDERAKNFERLFKALDQSIAFGNNENLALILSEITDLAKSSPFKDLVIAQLPPKEYCKKGERS